MQVKEREREREGETEGERGKGIEKTRRVSKKERTTKNVLYLDVCIYVCPHAVAQRYLPYLILPIPIYNAIGNQKLGETIYNMYNSKWPTICAYSSLQFNTHTHTTKETLIM